MEAPLTDEKPLGDWQVTMSTAPPAPSQTPYTGLADSGGTAEEITEAPAQEQAIKAVKKPKRSAKFWTELTAWVMAILLLIGALVYYNFIDVPKNVPMGYQVGETAPDFTVQRIGEDGEFNLYEHRGKVTVINFWATWCTPCKAELPYFNELSASHTEWNVIAIHGTLAGGSPEDYIAKECSDWTLPFAQDNLEGTTCLTYEALGGKGSWPLTVMVNEKGIVIYNSIKPFHSYEELETTVLGAIANQEN